MSWWDSAAVAVAGGGTSADSGLRLHTRGRNHARADIKDAEKIWNLEWERFVGNDQPAPQSPTVKVPPLQLPDPAAPCLSPCHFEKRYGGRSFVAGKAFLSPRARLSPRLAPIAPSTLSQREKVNAEARQACWGGERTDLVARTALMQDFAASSRWDAAAAV